VADITGTVSHGRRMSSSIGFVLSDLRLAEAAQGDHRKDLGQSMLPEIVGLHQSGRVIDKSVIKDQRPATVAR
jgi:hypothetical protein